MLVWLEIALYLLLGVSGAFFFWGAWRYFAPSPVPLVPVAPPRAPPQGAPIRTSAPASSAPASASTRSSSPASTRSSAPRSKLQREIDGARELLGDDIPEAVIVLAAASRHQRCGLVAVPQLTRPLIGAGLSPEEAIRWLLHLDARRVLELRPDESPASHRAQYLCPRGHGDTLLGVARIRVGEPVNAANPPASAAPVTDAEHAAGDEPELHYAAPGDRHTACRRSIGQLAEGLVGGRGELRWTTHGPGATCPLCRRAIGLPTDVPAEVQEDGETVTFESVPASFRTLVSEQPQGGPRGA